MYLWKHRESPSVYTVWGIELSVESTDPGEFWSCLCHWSDIWQVIKLSVLQFLCKMGIMMYLPCGIWGKISDYTEVQRTAPLQSSTWANVFCIQSLHWTNHRIFSFILSVIRAFSLSMRTLLQTPLIAQYPFLPFLEDIPALSLGSL